MEDEYIKGEFDEGIEPISGDAVSGEVMDVSVPDFSSAAEEQEFTDFIIDEAETEGIIEPSTDYQDDIIVEDIDTQPVSDYKQDVASSEAMDVTVPQFSDAVEESDYTNFNIKEDEEETSVNIPDDSVQLIDEGFEDTIIENVETQDSTKLDDTGAISEINGLEELVEDDNNIVESLDDDDNEIILEEDVADSSKLENGNDVDVEDTIQDVEESQYDDEYEEEHVKVLKRDEQELMEAGQRNIEDILDVKADDYRDKGYTEEEISELLKDDRVELENEFLHDAFPDRFENDAEAEISEEDEIIDNIDNIDNFESEDSMEPEGYNLDSVDENISDIDRTDDLEEWIGEINPNFDEFDLESPYANNCGSCAYAVYQRLEGLSDDSCASAENIGYNSEMNALTGMEQVSMDPEEIEARLLEEGDGAHAIIGIDRAEGPGHWFNAACINGKVVAIDGQNGAIIDWPPDYGDVVNWEMSVKKGE